MANRVLFYGFQVPELKMFLQDRGISCSIGRKLDLVRLCVLAEELQLGEYFNNRSKLGDDLFFLTFSLKVYIIIENESIETTF